MYRQGDVFLIPVPSIPAEAATNPRQDGRIVLAYGEASGHAHAIYDEGADLMVANDAVYLEVNQPVALRHEEHAEISIPIGLYVVRRQVEWSDDDEPIRVSD